MTWARTPMTGFFGTDFWHAVEFSRNGRAPVRVSRPVVGQPLHAMSAAVSLSKRLRAVTALAHAVAESVACAGVPHDPAASRVRLRRGGGYEGKNAAQAR